MRNLCQNNGKQEGVTVKGFAPLKRALLQFLLPELLIRNNFLRIWIRLFIWFRIPHNFFLEFSVNFTVSVLGCILRRDINFLRQFYFEKQKKEFTFFD
jgi:hypothetical protein